MKISMVTILIVAAVKLGYFDESDTSLAML